MHPIAVVGIGMGSFMLGHIVAPLFGQVKLPFQYLGNSALPVTLPTTEALLEIFRRTTDEELRADWNALRMAFYANGVDIDKNVLWNRIRTLPTEALSSEVVRRIVGPTFPTNLKITKGEEEEIQKLFRRIGLDEKYVGKYWPYVWYPFTPEQTVLFEMREILPKGIHEDPWHWLGLAARYPGGTSWADTLRWANAYIPGVSDLLHFQVREAFDERVVQKYGYDEEYPYPLEVWFRKQGMGYRLNEFPNTPGQPPKTWGQIYWRAHWNVPSPTQAYQMLVLNRPSRAVRVAADWQKIFPGLDVRPEDLAVTPAEVRDVLKLADYPRYWRDRLMALTYSPMTQRFLQQTRTDLVPDPVPLVERVQDLGFLPTEAEVIAEMIERRSALARANAGIGLSPREAVQLYVNGHITIQEVDAVNRALGLAPLAAQALRERAIVRRQVARQKRVLSIVKRGFLRRTIDGAQARRILAGFRVPDRVIEEELEEWRLELFLLPRRRTVNDLLRDWEWGVADRATVENELVSLGYPVSDARRIMRQYLARRLDARAQRVMRIARQIEADAERRIAKAEKREREARKLAKEARIELEKARKEIERRFEEAKKEAEKARKEAEKAAQEGMGMNAEEAESSEET